MQNSFDNKNTNHSDNGKNKDAGKGTVHVSSPHLKNRPNEKELFNVGLRRLVSSINTSRLPRLQATNANNLRPTPLKLRENDGFEAQPSEIVKHNVTHNHNFEEIQDEYRTNDSTMTDGGRMQQKQLANLDNLMLSQEPFRDMQWTDPRLLKKYSMVKQPFRKSATIPIAQNEDVGNELISDISEEDEVALVSIKKRYSIIYISMLLVGSLCGIAFITVIFWKILDEYLAHTRVKRQPDFFLKIWARNLAGSFVNVINSSLEMVKRALTVTTREALAKKQEETAQSSWTSNIFNL